MYKHLDNLTHVSVILKWLSKNVIVTAGFIEDNIISCFSIMNLRIVLAYLCTQNKFNQGHWVSEEVLIYLQMQDVDSVVWM